MYVMSTLGGCMVNLARADFVKATPCPTGSCIAAYFSKGNGHYDRIIIGKYSTQERAEKALKYLFSALGAGSRAFFMRSNDFIGEILEKGETDEWIWQE